MKQNLLNRVKLKVTNSASILLHNYVKCNFKLMFRSFMQTS